MADAAFGVINPSGKLPFTWFAELEDYPAHGMDAHHEEHGNYLDAWRIGYRHAEAAGPKPIFSFRRGLSYTTFELSDLKVELVNSSEVMARVFVQVEKYGKPRRVRSGAGLYGR